MLGGNNAQITGGGLYVEGSEVTVEGAEFVNNTAEWGAGMSVDDGGVLHLFGGYVHANYAVTVGGGAWLDGGSAHTELWADNVDWGTAEEDPGYFCTSAPAGCGFITR